MITNDSQIKSTRENSERHNLKSLTQPLGFVPGVKPLLELFQRAAAMRDLVLLGSVHFSESESPKVSINTGVVGIVRFETQFTEVMGVGYVKFQGERPFRCRQLTFYHRTQR